MSTTKVRFAEAKTHEPTDPTDPGFALPGHKLRWLSFAVESRRAGRIWEPLKVSMLPKEIIATLKGKQPSWFGSGDTFRRRELTLAFASREACEKVIRNNQEQQRANEAILRGDKRHAMGQGAYTEASQETVVTGGNTGAAQHA